MMRECPFVYDFLEGLLQVEGRHYLGRCHLLLPANENESVTPTPRADLAREDVSADYNRLYINNRIREMLEGEGFKALEVDFAFSEEILDRATGEGSGNPNEGFTRIFSSFNGI